MQHSCNKHKVSQLPITLLAGRNLYLCKIGKTSLLLTSLSDHRLNLIAYLHAHELKPYLLVLI